MSSQTYYEISLDLFGSSIRWPPHYTVRSFHVITIFGQCTCDEILKRQLRSARWEDKFTLKILCLSSSSLAQALGLMRADQTTGWYVLDGPQQLAFLFTLKQLCECDRRNLVSPQSMVRNDWGLLDRDLEDRGVFHDSLVPVSTSSDQILRPTATVLNLARIQNPECLAERIQEEVERVILAKLSVKEDLYDNKLGCVYIMKRQSAPKFLKIGFSRKHAAIRNDALKNCFQDLRVIACTSMVPQAGRIEKLVHAELMYYRRAQDCGQCGTQHSEWFEIDFDIAKAVVLRWSRWLAARPYDVHSGKLKQEWKGTLIKEKSHNTVAAVNKEIKRYLQPLHEEPYLNEATETLRALRKKVQSVSLELVAADDSSCWHSPRKEKKPRPWSSSIAW